MNREWSKERLIECCEPEPNTGCWLWSKCSNKDGYGTVNLKGTKIGAHRFSYILFNKVTLNREDFVCHKCDTPACINPDHLFLGTAKSNALDKARKGRSKNGYSGRSHCFKGHEFNLDNTNYYTDPSGVKSRVCRACNRETYHLNKKKLKR